MSRVTRHPLSMTVNRTSDFILNGATVFAVKGISMAANGQDKFYTLCIPAGSVESRQLLCELSLLSHGNVIKVEFDGRIAEDGYVNIDQLHDLEIRR
jgi:hypothetical protein